jgi:uncharacterized protein
MVARGVCSGLLEHGVRSHTVVSPPALLDELWDVLTRKFRQRDADVREAVSLLAETFTLVTPPALDRPVCRDPDDDLVLATALASSGLLRQPVRFAAVRYSSVRIVSA